jgi:acyl carrier protein
LEHNNSNLSFEEFQVMLSDILDVSIKDLKPEAYFITDLGVDSLKLAELFLRFQKLGFEFSPDLIWRLQTVGDAFQYFQSLPAQ